MLLCMSTINQMLSCEWFSHCGDKNAITDVSCIYIDDATLVSKMLLSSRLENAIYDAQGDISSYLCVHHRSEYREWNALVQQIKDEFFPILTPNIRKGITNLGLPKDIISCIEYSVLITMLSSCYDQYYHSLFFDCMKKIYLSGHIPCGWKGKYPKGCFVIY